MTKGNLYRHSKMVDVDFYVTNVSDSSVTGYWLLRTNRNILNSKPDCIDKDDFNFADWTTVPYEQN